MPHTEVSLRAVAVRLDVTPPALIKHFGGTTGFLAALGTMQWERLHRSLATERSDLIALALTDVMWSFDNPHRFRLLYEPSLWMWETDPQEPSQRRQQTSGEIRRMTEAKFNCYVHFLNAAGNDELLTKMVTSLTTGLALEFVNERLFAGESDEQKRRDLCEKLASTLIRKAVGGRRTNL